MIAKEEYLKALEVVEAYHKQIKKESEVITFNKTPLEDWEKFFIHGTPARCNQLFNKWTIDSLKKCRRIYYIEDLLDIDLTKMIRGIGKKTKRELQEEIKLILSTRKQRLNNQVN